MNSCNGNNYDKDTKLTKFGYREYDSNMGRWTTKDPIDFNGGDFNLYGYVLGEPGEWGGSYGVG
jgi:RHS repeat-associated protein